MSALARWFPADVVAALTGKLTADSRQVQAGDALVLCLPTGGQLEPEQQQRYVDQAAANGAVAVVLDGAAPVCRAPVPLLRVPNLRAELSAIAGAYYGTADHQPRVVGITGTNGKTTCANWYAQLAERHVGRAGVIGTLGAGLVGEVPTATGFTTPDILGSHRLLMALAAAGAQTVAVEVSSHALDQGRIDGITVDTAILTNVSRDHLDYHGSLEAYAAAKRRLFERESLQLAVINADDELAESFARVARAPVLRYGLENASADLGVERLEVTGSGTVASIWTPWGKGVMESRYPGGYNVLNLLAVIAALCGRGADLSAVLADIGQLQAVPGRTQTVSTQEDDIAVVVDFAHTPDALANVLGGLRRAGQPLLCVFGCGGDRDRGKRPEMAAIAEQLADQVIVTSDNPRSESPEAIVAEVVAGFRRQQTVIIDRAQAIATAISGAPAGALVVIAGKGHENYQESQGVKWPFSDVDEALRALVVRRGGGRA